MLLTVKINKRESRKHRIQIYFIAELLYIGVVTRNSPPDAKGSSYLAVSSSDAAARLEPVLSPADSSTCLRLLSDPHQLYASYLVFYSPAFRLALSIYYTFCLLRRVEASRVWFRFQCCYCGRTFRNFLRFQVLTAESMSTDFWDIAPCSLVETNRHF